MMQLIAFCVIVVNLVIRKMIFFCVGQLTLIPANFNFSFIVGMFLGRRQQFLKYLEKEKNLFYDPSSKNISHGSIVYKNGVRHSMSLNILDPRLSKFQMSDLCKQIAQSGESTNHLSIDSVDKTISESEQYVIDPELGLYFDDVCCTFGLLPWQLRLTEFHQVKFYSKINVTHFLDALYIYSKCEQRFGK